MLRIDNVVEERVEDPADRELFRPWLWWILAVLPFMVLAVWRATHGAGEAADDYGQYLMHAQALAEGRPYGDIGYIYSHYAPWVGPRLEPPGLPVTLAPFIAVFGANMVVLKALMLAFAFAFVAMAGLYFWRHDDKKLALGMVLLCGLSPAVIHNASQVLTDIPFAAIVWALIFVVDSPGSLSWKRIALITLLGAYAVSFRPTGLAVVLSLGLFTLLQFRRHGVRPMVPVAIWVAGLLAIGIVMDINRAAVISVNPAAVYEWIFVERLPLENISAYASALVDSHLHPFPWPAANDAFHVLTVLLMVVGLVGWARTGYDRFAAAFGLMYGFTLVILPLNHPRYLWPLYPFFVYGLLNGIRIVVAALGRLPARQTAVAFAIVLVPPAMLRVINEPRPVDLRDIPEVDQVFRYIEQKNSQEPMRITFFKPRTIAWETGVTAMGPLQGEPACLLGELEDQEITHVVLGSLAGGRNSAMRRVVAEWPNRFAREYENSRFTVYRFHRTMRSASTNRDPAC